MKKLALGMAVATVGAVGLVGANTASAQTTGESLVDRMATRFNLNADEVQEVFDEQRAEKRAERQAARTAALEQLVEDGTITQDQLEALEAKTAELKEAKQELKDQDLSREEIKAELEGARAEFQEWAEAEGIDLDAIRGSRGDKRGDKRSTDNTDQTVETEATSTSTGSVIL